MRFASVLLFSLFITLFSKTHSQTTTNCLEIENILVAACGTPEGQNEMVRVLVGPNPINANNMIVDWPTAITFGGWTRNATTATKTAQINASITSCGYVLEAPSNWMIPANKKILIVTSYNMIPTANSFANLTDTLYILFHNSLSIAGYFKNYDASLTPSNSTRTLSISYTGCTTETVTYDALLLDHTGNTSNAGASVSFTQNGTASYYNNGCTAPISQFSVDAGPNPPAVCPGGTVSLSATIIGNSTFRQWSGGTGTFSTPGNLTTNYTLAANQTAPFFLYFKAKGACADTLKDSVLITIQQQNPIQITANGPLSICTGENLTLTASGGGSSYQWTGGPATAQYTINTPGTYIVQSSDACYNYQQSITVSASNLPNISIAQSNTSICPGATITATATATGNIVWNNGTNGASISINSPGQYIATVTNGCGTASDTIVVTAGQMPSALIQNVGPIILCANTDVVLNGSGNGTLTWNNGTNGTSTTVNGEGTYWLVSQTVCGTDTAFIIVETHPVDAQFTADPTNGYAPLTVNITNQSTNATTYAWNFGNGNTSTSESPNQVFTEPGTYTVTLIATNAQGCIDSTTVQITVANQMTVELPNIFTPNGDQVNDEYIIKALGVTSFRADIYNRWGEKMFSWTDPDMAWNGKSPLGALASSGVYFCVAEATDALGKKFTYKTSVTLIH